MLLQRQVRIGGGPARHGVRRNLNVRRHLRIQRDGSAVHQRLHELPPEAPQREPAFHHHHRRQRVGRFVLEGVQGVAEDVGGIHQPVFHHQLPVMSQDHSQVGCHCARGGPRLDLRKGQP